MTLAAARLLTLAVTAVVFAQPVTAQQAVSATAPPQLFSAGYIAQVLGSLALVFFGIFLVVFLLRRVNRIGGGAGSTLRVLASASVGQRERVVLIEVGDEQLLVGVAPGNVRALHTLERPIEAPGAAQSPADFASLLRAANPLGSGAGSGLSTGTGAGRGTAPRTRSGGKT